MAQSKKLRPRVLLADDHRLILDGVRASLEESGEFEVVGEAMTGNQVLALVNRTQPDIVVLDIRMPGMDGLVCLDQIKKRHPEIKVIVLSASTDPKLIENVLKRGASAYIVKSVNPVDLPSAIRQALDETVYTAIGLPDDSAASAAKSAGLTARELAILTALAQGNSNAAIAKELWVAPQTVKFHLTNIYRKLNVANRPRLPATPTSRGSSRARSTSPTSSPAGERRAARGENRTASSAGAVSRRERVPANRLQHVAIRGFARSLITERALCGSAASDGARERQLASSLTSLGWVRLWPTCWKLCSSELSVASP